MAEVRNEASKKKIIFYKNLLFWFKVSLELRNYLPTHKKW